MLGGTARALNNKTKGFDADTATALEEVTAFFAKADVSKGGGLYRPAIVAQLAEVARRIQDGVAPSLKTRVFAATADLAALAGWVSHDAAHYPVGEESLGRLADTLGKDTAETAEYLARTLPQATDAATPVESVTPSGRSIRPGGDTLLILFDPVSDQVTFREPELGISFELGD